MHMYTCNSSILHLLLLCYFIEDIEFVKTFLLTYQSFATPDKLLRKLIERYNVVLPEGMPRSQFGHIRQTIQARVINALRLWVEYGVDFKGEREGTGLLCRLLNDYSTYSEVQCSVNNRLWCTCVCNYHNVYV